MNQKHVISALTSALYRLVETIDEVNTCGPHFDRDSMEEAAAEIWLHLAEARKHALPTSSDPFPSVEVN